MCVYVHTCNTFYKHTSWADARGAHDQVFSTDRTQPLVAEPGEPRRSISVPISREKFGNRPTRGTRRQGNKDLTRPIVARPERSFRDLRGGGGRLRASLTRYVDRSIVTRY